MCGSKIALFGCPEKEALATIGNIEVAEGLPHPMLDGVWGKISPTARLRSVQADAQPPELPSDKQTVLFRCTAAGASAPQVRVRFQTLGSLEPVGGGQPAARAKLP
ncbi:MAG: hypothetical protein NTY19_19985 [Planctomycetota bacterium]|nr:hypothetical protein [Planctomycetota bacterium]